MDTLTKPHSNSSSVFEASTKDPQAGVAAAVADVAKILAKYAENEDVTLRMQLLTEVEALRRFVLVRGALLRAMQQTGNKGLTLGRELCDSLRSMIGEQPETVRSYLAANAGMLPPAVVREVRKKLETGRKAG